MKFDFLHCALLAVVVLLAVYVARSYGFFSNNPDFVSVRRPPFWDGAGDACDARHTHTLPELRRHQPTFRLVAP